MAKTPEFPQLSETQLEIMNIVWRAGEATVGEVWKALAVRRKVARNTVLTLMERLEKKGWLRRRADGHVFRYAAARDAKRRSAKSWDDWSTRRSMDRPQA
jgi:predicted transcriptional regulator